MTEKEMFINSYEREYNLTCSFLDAFPADHYDFRPNTHLQSAAELAWLFPEEERIYVGGSLDGDVVFKMNEKPALFEEIKRVYIAMHDSMLQRIKDLPDDAFNEMVTFGSGSENAQQMRRGDIFWLAITDTAHHRGQFSVYIRLAGGKAPPLY